MSFVAKVKQLVPAKLKLLARKMHPCVLVVAWDRLRGNKIFLFHLPIVGEQVYIAPIMHEIRRRRVKASIYLLVDDELVETNSALSQSLGVAESRILRWRDRATLGTVDAFITPTQWVGGNTSATVRICIFHGQPTKGLTFLPHLISRFNTLFLLGPLQRSLYEAFAAANPAIARNIKALNVGYPKSDALLNGQFSRQDILDKLNLDPAKPVVIYAPAFDKGAALDMYGELVVEYLLKGDASVIVKLHPMCYEPQQYAGGVNWTERLRKFEGDKRFRHVGNQALDPYLAASDVLVTDVSSASFEFMMLDRPVVFVDCPDFFTSTLGTSHYLRKRDEILRDIRLNAGRSAGLVVHTLDALPAAITRSLQYGSEFSAQRQAVRAQLLYNPGTGGVAATDALLSLTKCT